MNPLIAIVDDDASARDAAASLVRALGFDAAVFPGAAEFLQSAERARAACLILDMRMPEMSGLELYRHLTASVAPLPTVMVTAHPSDDSRDVALAAGVRFYLAKPLEPDALFRVIRSAIEEAGRLSMQIAGENAQTAFQPKGEHKMSTITTKDGTEIFFKDWGPKDAQPIMFHHGWPLSADDWDAQMLFFLQNGYRVVAHDRRGHGRSAQVPDGHDMDHYAADAFAVVEHLDLKNAVHIGHSTGGGEVARYVAKHGEPAGRVAKAVLVSAVPPLMLKTESNPEGLPIEVFDGFRKGVADNRAQLFVDVAAGPFYGFNREGATVYQGVVNNWWRQGMMGSAKAHYDGIKAFSETDQTADLKAISVPTLVMHGDDDQIVPIADSALKSVKLLKNGTLKVYKGFPHGMLTTHAEIINPDLLAFIKG